MATKRPNPLQKPVHPYTALAVVGGVVVLAILAIIVTSLNSKPTATRPSAINPTTTQSINAPAKTSTTFTSPDLGISFDYDTLGGTYTAKEIGNRVYIYQTNLQPDSGNFVEVFKKDPSQSLKDAIEQQLLKGYSPDDCIATLRTETIGWLGNGYLGDSIIAPGSYIYAQIRVPQAKFDAASGPGDKQALGEKCPQPYTYAGGVYYFLEETHHPDKFLFFSIGESLASAGYINSNITFNDTIRFLNSTNQ